MTCTCPTCNFGMEITHCPFYWDWSYPPCTATLFARNGTCAGCAESTVSAKNRTSPPPLRWQPPSPGYLKWLGGNARGACNLVTASPTPPHPPKPIGLTGIDIKR